MRVRVTLALGLAMLALAVGIPSAFGTPGTAQSSVATVSCTVADVYLDGPQEISAIATCAYVKIGDPSRILLSWGLHPQSADDSVAPEFGGKADFTDPATGTTTSAWEMNGFGSGAEKSLFTFGGYLLSSASSLESGLTNTDIAGGTFTLSRSKSRITSLRIRSDGRFVLPTRVSARVSATTSQGKVIPVDGQVIVDAKAPGGHTWGRLPSGRLNARGNFEAAYPRFVKGTKLRVSIVDCAWCSDASATTTVR